jgi:inosose dehydratase
MIPRRLAEPAVGAGFDAGRLHDVIDRIAVVCESFTREGVTPLLHPHVGGWVETEPEVRQVLASVEPELLGFGPNTGTCDGPEWIPRP